MGPNAPMGAGGLASIPGWILVVGMHRSGTSAMAGALHVEDTQVPHDDIVAPGNPAFNESRQLTKWNEGALRALDGSWHCPPRAEALDDQSRRLAAESKRLAPILGGVFLDRKVSIIKDPRLCLLMPIWRDVLGGHVINVLIWRSPLEVAQSLASRSLPRPDGLDVISGLALWEYYNGRALMGLAGLPTVVVKYDSLLSDPEKVMANAGKLLPHLGEGGLAPAEHWHVGNDSKLSSGFRHHTLADDARLLSSQTRLVEQLTALDGYHASFPRVTVEPLCAWSESIIESMRKLGRARAGYEPLRSRRRLRYYPKRVGRWALRNTR